MKHRHPLLHLRRHAHHPIDEGDDHRRRHHHGRGSRRGGRPFDNGELRLVILKLIADAPCHGYELIKDIGDRMGGSYSPSPGVIYPTLAMLEELGNTSMEADASGRKRYTITEAGRAFLAANESEIAAIFARLGTRGEGGSPAPIIRAMENLKMALRLKMSGGALPPAQVQTIAAALDAAALAVERAGAKETSI